MRYLIKVALMHPRTTVLGFIECLGDVGMSYGDDQDRSEAYDVGRDIGRKLFRLD